jgi:hypothetical protein
MAWKINDYCTDKRGYIRITDDDLMTVCDIFPFAGIGGQGLDKARENARKIANSEQLWDALQGLMDWCAEGCPDGGRYALTEADAAIKMIRSIQ